MVTTLTKPQPKQIHLCQEIQDVFKRMFDQTCQAIQQLDGTAFEEHTWQRNKNGQWISGDCNESEIYIDRTLNHGNIFEKIGRMNV